MSCADGSVGARASQATRLSEVPFIKAADVDEKSLGRMGELVSYLALQQGEYVFEQVITL